MNQNSTGNDNNINEISIVDLFAKIQSIVSYLKSKRLVIAVAALIGVIAGLTFSIVKKTKYLSVCTFVLEDSKSGNYGQYGGLAALAGINLGSNSNGIFEGDNILELYKSRTMIEKTLLTECNIKGKKQLLINRFIDTYKLSDPSKPEKRIKFTGDTSLNRDQDSVISNLADMINAKILNVNKPDKKLNIISVEVTTTDELLSKFFTEKLVQTVNDFYVQTRTKKTIQDVKILQHQTDSVRLLLNSSINGVAAAIDASPNPNPQMLSLRTSSQKKQIDVQTNTGIYGEMQKNLQLAEISLREETPLIQIIDKPVLPLKKIRIGKMKGMIIGGIISGFLAVLWFTLKKIFNSVLSRS